MLSQLRGAHPEIESLGAGALVVGTGADFQARQLMNGIVILDPECTIRYLHRGTTLGDYPPLVEVLRPAIGGGHLTPPPGPAPRWRLRRCRLAG